LLRWDFAGYDRARDAQKEFARFRPVITHSHYEPAGQFYFHPQLLSNWATIEEMGLKVLEELDGHSAES
jgi:hypothetical protein